MESIKHDEISENITAILRGGGHIAVHPDRQRFVPTGEPNRLDKNSEQGRSGSHPIPIVDREDGEASDGSDDQDIKIYTSTPSPERRLRHYIMYEQQFHRAVNVGESQVDLTSRHGGHSTRSHLSSRKPIDNAVSMSGLFSNERAKRNIGQ